MGSRRSKQWSLAFFFTLPLALATATAACDSESRPAQAAHVAADDTSTSATASSTLRGLAFSVSAPAAAPYEPESLGIGGRAIVLHVRNNGSRPIPTAGLEVSFTATRQGVAFQCASPTSRTYEERIPPMLDPGATIAIHRPLTCALPLPGVYEIRTFVRGTPAGSFRLELTAGARAPRPLGPAGVFAFMTGGKATRPLTPSAWSAGDYHVVFALINGSPHTIRFGPAKISFVVFKKGSPYPCTSEAKPLHLPEQLVAGGVYVARLPISCAPSDEGQYEVSGRVTLEGGDDVEVGRLGLRVTRDPLLFAPLPL